MCRMWVCVLSGASICSINLLVILQWSDHTSHNKLMLKLFLISSCSTTTLFSSLCAYGSAVGWRGPVTGRSTEQSGWWSSHGRWPNLTLCELMNLMENEFGESNLVLGWKGSSIHQRTIISTTDPSRMQVSMCIGICMCACIGHWSLVWKAYQAALQLLSD